MVVNFCLALKMSQVHERFYFHMQGFWSVQEIISKLSSHLGLSKILSSEI